MTTTRAAVTRASLYVRLSREANPDNTSLDTMTSALRELVARERFTEVALHVDNGSSGGYRDRTEFMAWLADAKSGRADVLAAFSVDRMTREGANVAGPILDLVEGKDPDTGRPLATGHRVRLMDTQGLDSAGDPEAFRWSFVIKAEVARAERQRISERNLRASRALRAAGRWAGGGAPYGYRIITDDTRPGKYLALEPSEAEAVREAAERCLAGQPLGSVARWMSENHSPRRAAAWSRVTLRQVLTGDAVLGYTKVDGALLRDGQGKPVQAWPAILTPAEVAELRKLLAPMPDARKGGRHPARLLSGFLVCSGCGARLQVARRTRGGATYRCPTKSDGGTCNASVTVAAEALEQYVERCVLEEHGEVSVMEDHVVVGDDGGAAEIDEAIAATLRALGENPTTDLFARLQSLKAEKDALAASARSAPAQTATVWTGRTFADDWRDADHLDDRRRLLASVLTQVAVSRGRPGPRGVDPERLDVVWAERPGWVAVVSGRVARLSGAQVRAVIGAATERWEAMTDADREAAADDAATA